jgi:hypothetical protein
MRRLLLISGPLADCPPEMAEQIGKHNAILRDITASMEMAFSEHPFGIKNEKCETMMLQIEKLFGLYIKQPRF